MTAVGFLDDDETKVGKLISGVAVLGTLKSLPDVVRRHAVNEVIIAMPTAPGSMLRAVADACRAQNITSKTIPGVFELLHGRVEINRLRHVDISDLLRRNPVSAPLAEGSYVSDRVVLVTGAGGSIGSELCRQVAAAGPARIVLVGHGENSLFDAQNDLRDAFPSLPIHAVIADVRNRQRLDAIFRRFRPAVVFHAAAHKHVPLLEDNVEEAISNNVRGTKNVVDAALAIGVKRLVMISTDKAASPVNVMGASKRLAEMCVRDAAARHGVSYVVVRFGNVLGSRGSVVPFFKRQIERGGPVTVTHPDMTRFFMTIPEAVHLVLQAGGLGLGGELYVLDMGQPVRIVDLARDLITLSGLTEDDIPIVFSGIRPGEKLDERLWEDGSDISQTACEGIMRVVEPTTGAMGAIDRMIESLTAACLSGDRLEIEAELARWIPSYVPDMTLRTRVSPVPEN
jgi:FlaA1/EpsC-like NDP-sugar epimerase